MHQKYHGSLFEFNLIEKDPIEVQPMDKKYLNNINRLNQEMQIMSTQLKQAHETISMLTNKLNETNHRHTIQIQELHERHEQKIAKIKTDIDKLYAQATNKSLNNSLQKIIMEKNFEIEEQQKIFNDKINCMTEQFQKQLKFKEKEHSVKISTLKGQFLEVIQELKEKFLNEIEGLQKKYKTEVEQVKEAMKVLGSKEAGASESEISTAIEIDHEKNIKHQDSLSDLQIIEELSFQQNIFIKPLEEDSRTSSELDKSLRQLINQISFDGEVSLTDILNR